MQYHRLNLDKDSMAFRNLTSIPATSFGSGPGIVETSTEVACDKKKVKRTPSLSSQSVSSLSLSEAKKGRSRAVTATSNSTEKLNIKGFFSKQFLERGTTIRKDSLIPHTFPGLRSLGGKLGRKIRHSRRSLRRIS